MIALFTLSWAFAHGLDADQVVVDVTDDTVLLAFTPRAATFPGADDDGDGRLSVDEVRRHRDLIETMVDDGLVLRDQRGRRGETYFRDVVLPHAFDADAHGAEHLRVLQRLRFPDPVTAVRLDVGLFADGVDALPTTVRMNGRTERFRADAPRSRVQMHSEPSTPSPPEAAPASGPSVSGAEAIGAGSVLGALLGLGVALFRPRGTSPADAAVAEPTAGRAS
jgi:hypothetical protein